MILAFLNIRQSFIEKRTFIEKRKNLPLNMEKALILFFLLTQSLSLLPANNIFVFLQRYSKILIGILAYFVTKRVIKEMTYKQIFSWLFFGFLIALIFQIILLFLSDFFFNVGLFLIHENVLNITKANYDSGKLFDDTYLEVVIPILIFYLLEKQRRYRFKKIIIFVTLFITSIIAFASNFRYRALTFSISLIASIIFLGKGKNIVKNLVAILIAVFIFLPLFDKLASNLNSYSLIDRVVNQKEYEKTGTIAWRLKMFDKSIELSRYSLFGVGLGNMADYLNKNSLPLDRSLNLKAKGALESGPHNIFFQLLAETGFVGLISFLMMLIYFIRKDIAILKTKDITRKTLIICFWTLIFSGQFFPAINLTFYVIFFVMRGLI